MVAESVWEASAFLGSSCGRGWDLRASGDKEWGVTCNPLTSEFGMVKKEGDNRVIRVVSTPPPDFALNLRQRQHPPV